MLWMIFFNRDREVVRVYEKMDGAKDGIILSSEDLRLVFKVYLAEK